MDRPDGSHGVVLTLSFSEDGESVGVELVDTDSLSHNIYCKLEIHELAADLVKVVVSATEDKHVPAVSEESNASGIETEVDLSAEESYESPYLSPNKPNFIPIDIPSEQLMAELEEQAAEMEAGELPEGYIPRGKCMSPMEKKIKRFQDECWAGVPFDPKPHVSRLEKDVGTRSPCRILAREMVEAAFQETLRSNRSPSPAKQSLSSLLVKHKSKLEREKEAAASAAAAGQEVQVARRVTAAAEGPSLSETLKVHKSRLELEKEAAAVAAAQEQPQPWRSVRRNTSGYEGPSLSDTLKVHKSKLELEKESATAAAAAITVSADASHRVNASHWEGPGLCELKPHKSRLEKDKEAAAAAAAAATQGQEGGGQRSRPGSASAYQGPSLGDSLKVHKSRLEREKEAAAATVAMAQQQQQAGSRVRAAAAGWEGMGGLGDFKIHKSKLERDKDAWVAAEAQMNQRRTTSNTVLSSLPSSAQPTEDKELPAPVTV